MILVRIFDGIRPYYYEANAFHAMLNNGGRLLNLQEPRTDLRVLARKNRINYFECKEGTRILTLLCPYNALVAAIQDGEALSNDFSAHGYALPNVFALEPVVEEQGDAGERELLRRRLHERAQRLQDRDRNIPAHGIGQAPAVAPVGPAPVPGDYSFWGKSKRFALWLAVPAIVGLSQGLLNNHLALRAGDGLKRWSFLDAPEREYATALVALSAHLLWAWFFERENRRHFPGSRWAVFGMFLTAGLFQELGEACPLPGSAGHWRTFSKPVELWKLNFTLGCAFGTLCGHLPW